MVREATRALPLLPRLGSGTAGNERLAAASTTARSSGAEQQQTLRRKEPDADLHSDLTPGHMVLGLTLTPLWMAGGVLRACENNNSAHKSGFNPKAAAKARSTKICENSELRPHPHHHQPPQENQANIFSHSANMPPKNMKRNPQRSQEPACAHTHTESGEVDPGRGHRTTLTNTTF